MMPPAHLRAVREGLGLQVDWLADHLQVDPRTVHRWERGISRVPAKVEAALATLQQAQADMIAEHVEIFEGASSPLPPMLDIASIDSRDWPSGWLARVAFGVLQHVPDLVVIDSTDEAPAAKVSS